MTTQELTQEYERLIDFLNYTLHELPMGVLYGANGADEKECKELMADTYRLEELSKLLNVENSKFIEDCRWHYERYPHYLSRYKHFGNYDNYIVKYNGPEKVKAIIKKLS